MEVGTHFLTTEPHRPYDVFPLLPGSSPTQKTKSRLFSGKETWLCSKA